VSEVVDPKLLLDPALELAEIIAQWDSHELPLTEAYANGFENLIPHRGYPDAVRVSRSFHGKASTAMTLVGVGCGRTGIKPCRRAADRNGTGGRDGDQRQHRDQNRR